MSGQKFHPEAIIYSLYAILFFSNLFVAGILLSAVSVFLGQISPVNLLALPVPLLVGFILSEFLNKSRLMNSSVFGTLIVTVTTAAGYFSNSFMESYLVDSSASASDFLTRSATMEPLSKLGETGAELSVVFAVAVIGFNLPIFYRYLSSS
jgi:hypothetical protein